MNKIPSPVLFVAALVSLLAQIPGCGSDHDHDTPPAPFRTVPGEVRVRTEMLADRQDGGARHAGMVLDGELDDWYQDNTAWADGRYVYLTFAPEGGAAQAIQAAPYTTRIRIDADLNPRTGVAMEQPGGGEAIGAQPQGVDLLIEFSPKKESGELGGGCRVTRYDIKGEGEAIGHAGLGFACLPTYASARYEARLDRGAPGAALLRGAGMVEIVVDQVDPDGSTRWSTRMVAKLPPAARGDAGADATALPARPDGAVRVMSTNVLYSSPLKNPEPFARVLGAIEPDVVLYQEWFRTPAEEVQGWLDAHAGTGWSLHMPDERAGVAIASRLPVLATYDSVLPPSGEGRPARACAALIDTREGELLAISVHLKCCGGAGSGEDLTRIEQAATLNAFVREVHAKHPAARVIIGGDFNLVGSRIPLDTLAQGLAVRGGDLAAAQNGVLGDDSALTWVDERSSFSPGRLDWVLYDDSVSDVVNAFMLDTRRLDAGTLREAGLMAQDSSGSDHLPTVIDLVWTR